jgi:hypothetical protein
MAMSFTLVWVPMRTGVRLGGAAGAAGAAGAEAGAGADAAQRADLECIRANAAQLLALVERIVEGGVGGEG